jgi:hypothetical protein
MTQTRTAHKQKEPESGPGKLKHKVNKTWPFEGQDLPLRPTNALKVLGGAAWLPKSRQAF